MLHIAFLIPLSLSPHARAEPSPVPAGAALRAETFTLPEGSSTSDTPVGVAGVGDLNADGFDDVAINACGTIVEGSSGKRSGAGVVYVHYGAAAGLGAEPGATLLNSDPQTNDMFGWAVAGAGDLDGDGYDDMVASTPFDDSHGVADGGSISVFYGGPDGIDPSVEHQIAKSPNHYEDFGRAVDGAGDVNGDGWVDLIVGAPGNGGTERDDGCVWLFYGSSTGVDSSSYEQHIPADITDNDELGYAVAGLGDVDGDGFEDVAVGAPMADAPYPGGGAVYLMRGSELGLVFDEDRLEASDETRNIQFGRSVAKGGDVDGDGYGDLLVGASSYVGSNGRSYVYLGGVSGPEQGAEILLDPPKALDPGGFGWSIAGDIDLDGDGFDDVFVGAYYVDQGQVLLYPGGPGGPDSGSVSLLLHPEGETNDYFGRSVASAGDVDGDGFGELIVGNYLNVLFYGRCAAPSSYWADDDGDGYGDPEAEISACEQPEGSVLDASDCDDGDDAVHPGAEDTCGDGVDSDCDGRGGPEDDEDGDGLGFSEEEALGSSDCDEDSDDDGFGDAEEAAAGSDPADPLSTPDEGEPADSDTPSQDSGEGEPAKGGGCANAPAPGSWAFLLGALGLLGVRRRRLRMSQPV
jgi:MYXO-CTERM domain-containing protein